VSSPLILSSRVRGADGATAPSARVTLASIGVGGRGGALLSGFLGMADAQCVAVCDPFKDRREAWQQRVNAHYAAAAGTGSTNVCQAYGDLREMLARDDIDGVVIATPDHWHVPAAIAAAEAGKDLYVEKPLGLTVAQDIALRNAVQRHGRVFLYGTQQRSAGNFRFACELVRSGRIGRLHTMHAWCAGGAAGGATTPAPVPDGFEYDLWLGPAPVAPYTVDRCTCNGAYHISDYALGFIAGWGAHPLDIAQWGNDSDDTGPVEYHGRGEFPTGGLFDTALHWDVTCTYANGVALRFMDTATAKPVVEPYRGFNDHGTTFFGTDGWVSVDRGGIYAKPESLLKTRLGPEDTHLYVSDNHGQNLVDCIRSRAPTVCPIGAAVRSDTISQLSDIAIRTGRTIRWDPKAEAILGDDSAARMLSRPLRPPWHV
jgi:predicted dehydrogenase